MFRWQYLVVLLVFTFGLNSGFAQDSAVNAFGDFEEYQTDSVFATDSVSISALQHSKTGKSEVNGIAWTLSVVAFTILAGIFVQFKRTRQFRSLFLVLSVVILGFYRGGCPCSIQSLQNGILWLSGHSGKWPSLLLFAGLLPVTYLFGRVYCGWICQLGAFQEFIFKTSSFKLFQSQQSQKIMRIIRTIVLLVLIAQLIITKTNLYKSIDPFATVYSFYSSHWISWILVAIIIISSFIIYRPFCKTLCPVGLILGWISKIPGASVLGIKQNCISCVKGSRECSINAITHDNKISVLENEECIRCGECLKECPKGALAFFRRTRKHPDKFECKPSI